MLERALRVQFAEVFRLRNETLFLGVAIMDRFLNDRRRRPTATGDLQLLGTSCMLVAAKFEEAPPPRLAVPQHAVRSILRSSFCHLLRDLIATR